MNKIFDTQKLDEALLLLHEQLELHNAPHSEIVVCGGSALIAIGLVSRTTRDVDVVALMHRGELKHSEPLPEHIQQAATKVSEILGLPDDCELRTSLTTEHGVTTGLSIQASQERNWREARGSLYRPHRSDLLQNLRRSRSGWLPYQRSESAKSL